MLECSCGCGGIDECVRCPDCGALPDEPCKLGCACDPRCEPEYWEDR